MLSNRLSDFFFFFFFFRSVNLVYLRACYAIHVRIIYILKYIFNVSLKLCDIKLDFKRERSTKNLYTIRKYDVNDIYRIVSRSILDDN